MFIERYDKLIVSLLSNIAVMLINLYLIWRHGGGIYKPKMYNYRQIMRFIVLETIVGFFLINNPIHLSNFRFDFRAILFAFTTKYLGTQISVPVIILVSLFRLLVHANDFALLSMITSIVYVLLIKRVYNWIERRYNTLTQLLILLNLYIALSAPILLQSDSQLHIAVIIFVVVVLICNLFTIFIYSIYEDVRSLSNLSDRDGLTQLYNNTKFRMDLELLSKQRIQYTLLVIDIDHFKKVNDTYGHLVGDKVIQKTSHILKSLGGNDYLFYRFGGEEFVTVINDNDGQQVKRLAYKIQEAIRNLEIYVDNQVVLSITVSIGIAKRDGEEALIKTFERADRALYKAKNGGRNRIEVESGFPIFQEQNKEHEELLNIVSDDD